MRRRAWCGLGCAALALVALAAAHAAPETTEHVYSRGVYPHVRDVLRAVARPFPFSLGEALTGLLLVGLLAWFVRGLARALRGAASWRATVGLGAANASALLGLGLLAFELVWGLNHARLPLAVQLGLPAEPTDLARLRRAAERAVELAGADRSALDARGTAACDPRGPSGGLDGRMEEAWRLAGDDHPSLAGGRPCVRFPLVSPWMTLSSMTGVYSPFTAEAHVNRELLAMELPFTIAHEVAHERGFAREDEANFLGFFVTSFSPDAAVRYSGELFAVGVLLRALSRADLAAAAELRERLDPRVREDLAERSRFWTRASERPAAATFTAVTRTMNDAYLKRQGQAAGVLSYGRAVDLLVAHLGG